MNTIRQHIPDFVEIEPHERETAQFETVEELMVLPWVRNFTKLPGFYRFSVSNNGAHLIAEYRGGREWWVVGRLGHTNIDLPEWDHGWYEVMIDGKPDLIAGKDVVSSCGDEVRLRDGRVVTRRRED